MTSDIYALDEQEEFNDDAFAAYQDGLLQLFAESVQGKQFQADTGEEPGNWAGYLLYYGYAYLGTSPPRMTPGEASEIVNDLFPRKITLFNADDARHAITELKAFVLFLEETFQLGGSKAILQVLEQAEPGFGQRMSGGFPDKYANQKGHTKPEWEKKKKKLKAQKAARRSSRKKK